MHLVEDQPLHLRLGLLLLGTVPLGVVSLGAELPPSRVAAVVHPRQHSAGKEVRRVYLEEEQQQLPHLEVEVWLLHLEVEVWRVHLVE